jgi:Bacterial extracellular solute-binding proteins, family 3
MDRREYLLANLGALSVSIAGFSPSDALCAQSTSSITMSGGEVENDPRHLYASTLVKQALAISLPDRFVQIKSGMNQPRTAVALRTHRLDVASLPSLGFDHVRLHPIPLPIRRGLLGVRLLVTRRSDVEKFAKISSVSELKKRKMGFGETWSETKALRNLGFNIVGSADYLGMFELLRSGRADYLSRSVAEVWDEIQSPELAAEFSVVPGLALFYPIDDYLAVSKSNTAMILALENGLDQLLKSGVYWKVFNQFYGEKLKRTGIENRRILNVIGFGVDANTNLDLFDILELRPVKGEFRLPDGSNPGLKHTG